MKSQPRDPGSSRGGRRAFEGKAARDLTVLVEQVQNFRAKVRRLGPGQRPSDVATAIQVGGSEQFVVGRDHQVAGGILAARRGEDTPEHEKESYHSEDGWARRTHDRGGRLPSHKGLLCVSESHTNASIRKDKNRP